MLPVSGCVRTAGCNALKIFSSVTASYSHLPSLIKKIQGLSDEITMSVSTGDHELGFKNVVSGNFEVV